MVMVKIRSKSSAKADIQVIDKSRYNKLWHKPEYQVMATT